MSGIAAIDTADGEPPGLLNGYGVTAVLLVTGIATLGAGFHLIKGTSRWRSESAALVAVVNTAVAVVGLFGVVLTDETSMRLLLTGVILVAALLAAAAFRGRRRMAWPPRTARSLP